MAVNPKLIIMAVKSFSNEKVRKVLMNVIFTTLGVIMMIFVTFAVLLSGLFSVIQNINLKNRNYFKNNISELFVGIERNINTDIKSEVYDFMPEFFVNLSKTTIANDFDRNQQILYDEDEIQYAQKIMLDYAEKLRKIKLQNDFDSFVSGYDTELSFSEKVQFILRYQIQKR